MLTRIHSICRLAVVLLILGLVFSFASLAQSPDQSLKELTDASDLIVTGQVVDVWSERSSDGAIYSYALISPDALLKGEAPGKVVVRVPGGVVGDVGLWVSEAPTFSQGQTALLFLRGKGSYEVVGWNWGKQDVLDGRLSDGRELAEVERTIAAVAGGSRLASVARFDLPAPASGGGNDLTYVWTGLHWPAPNPMNEPFLINENMPGIENEAQGVIAALNTWSSVDCTDFRFTYGGPTTRAASGTAADGYNVVSWRNLDDGPIRPPGLTWAWYYYPNYDIFEADVALNSSYDWSIAEVPPPGLIDVQNVATHELGHALGLKDTYDPLYCESTMYGLATWAETKKRTLEPDDIEGLQAVYPAPCQGEPTPPPPSVSPTDCWATPGVWLKFTTVFSDELGWQNIRYADFLVNTVPDAFKGVYARYDVQQNLMFLRNPWDTAWRPLGGRVPGSEGIIKHTYGQLDVSQSVVVTASHAITIEWTMLFTWRASGQAQKLYLAQESVQGGGGSGPSGEGYFQEHGGYVVNRTPNWLIPPTDLSPRNGIADVSVPHWFDPAYRDPDRESTLDTLYFLIADSKPSDSAPDNQVPSGVYIKYVHNGGAANGRLYIWGGWSWLGPYLPNDPNGPVETARATLITRWSKSMYADFLTIKLLLRVKFKTSFLGKHNLYSRAIDTMGGDMGGDTGWKWKGTVDVR